MYEKYAKIHLESVKNHWKTNEKAMLLRDLQNLDFCDTSAVKTWFGMYLDDQKSMESHENLMENQGSKKLRKHIVQISKHTKTRLSHTNGRAHSPGDHVTSWSAGHFPK